MNRDDFHQQPRYAITLLGMSGVGKTHISQILSQEGWACFSCDYEIGAEYLRPDIERTLGKVSHLNVEDLSDLSAFVGQVGDSALGGLSLEEFKKRQSLYYMAECRSLEVAADLAATGEGHTIIDSTGSLCEIIDDSLIADLGQKTLFIYLQASPEDEQELLQRAQDTPKPLFFPPALFDSWLQDYLSERKQVDTGEIVPNDFSRWVFPRLLASRLPKYQRLADLYGVTVPAAAFQDVTNATDFIDVLAHHLKT